MLQIHIIAQIIAVGKTDSGLSYNMCLYKVINILYELVASINDAILRIISLETPQIRLVLLRSVYKPLIIHSYLTLACLNSKLDSNCSIVDENKCIVK